jgi:Na+-translocating ferredoxin:NAD+ oxidoreductase RnfD subunit
MAALSRVTAKPPTAAVRTRLQKLRRFLRSPKGYLFVALLALAALAAPSVGPSNAAPVLAGAVVGSAGMELALVRVLSGVWRFPSSALLTGLIAGMILGPHEPLPVAVIAGVLATDSKHLLRAGRSHIFNPAAFGLLAAYVLFDTAQSWWGALPELPPPAVAALILAGYLVAERANKLPAALAFLGVYTALFTGASFLGDPAHIGEVFRPPFLHAALSFAFFMVTDPPTSPVPFRDQFWFGALVAAVATGTYLAVQGIYFLPLAILAGNAVYALQRLARDRRHRRPGTAPAPVVRARPSAPVLTAVEQPPDSVWRRPDR